MFSFHSLQDFCDALFYHSFTECTLQDAPLLSDDFSKLLDKLNKLQWDSVKGDNNLGTPPTEKEITIYIEDTNSTSSPYRHLISEFMTSSNITVNFKHFMLDSDFKSLRRWRLSDVQVYLCDESGQTIKSHGDSYRDRIQIKVVYPTIFNDTDTQNNVYTFIGPNDDCISAYVVEGGKLP